jgi:hypothetical protein
MTKDEALRLALEALETLVIERGSIYDQAITAVQRALAQPEPNYKKALEVWLDKTEWVQETVKPHELGMHRADVLKQRIEEASPQRTWVGLTPACPQGLTEYACEVEGVDLVCFLEYTPDEEGSRDSRGLLDEPGTFENLELVNAYVKGTDVDIGHLLLQYLVDHITTTALEDLKNDDL